MNTQIILFLKENLQRIFTKSPLFFKIWSTISGLLVLVTGIPELVNSISGVITIPEVWNASITLAVAWASRAALFMSLLTTQSEPMLIRGDVVKVTNADKLPFTALAEQKIVEAVTK